MMNLLSKLALCVRVQHTDCGSQQEHEEKGPRAQCRESHVAGISLRAGGVGSDEGISVFPWLLGCGGAGYHQQ